MKHIPILFSTEMVQAILDVLKKMTRRTKGLEKINENPDEWKISHTYSDYDKKRFGYIFYKEQNKLCVYSPYSVGDILWVKEIFHKPSIKVMLGDYWYKADVATQVFNIKWTPSIYMPKAACRIFLRVTDVRCERLKDITVQDALDEGVYCAMGKYKNYLLDGDFFSSPITSFKSLWTFINGPKSWDDNPYVWVVSFERCERPENFI